ncbi:MAG: hypothetical protein V2A73_15520, partial [Pseudomonadota bacterium]
QKQASGSVEVGLAMCLDGQSLRYASTDGWQCADTITAVTAGSSLSGGGSAGIVELSLDPVTSELIADGSVTSDKIADGSIGTADLAPLCIDKGKIVPRTITGDRLALGAVDTGELANSAVTTVKIYDGAVGSAKLADGAVGSAKLAEKSITSEKLAVPALSIDIPPTLVVDACEKEIGGVVPGKISTAGTYNIGTAYIPPETMAAGNYTRARFTVGCQVNKATTFELRTNGCAEKVTSIECPSNPRPALIVSKEFLISVGMDLNLQVIVEAGVVVSWSSVQLLLY